MFLKILKIIFGSEKKYFLFVFLSVTLSLFSYILSNNITYSVKDYLKDQIKPIFGGDIVLSSREENNSKISLEKYKKTFNIAQTISINSTIFDNNKKPSLVNLVFASENYPFYDSFTYKVINSSGSIIIDEKTFQKYGSTLEILSKKYLVKGIINSSPIGDLSLYSPSNNIYIPIQNFPSDLNSTNSRISYEYFLKFIEKYDENFVKVLKNDLDLKNFRIKSLNDRNDNIGDITDRFYIFINFFNLTVFVLTFFIIILSLEIFFKKIKSKIALLNIFGMSKNTIFKYSFLSISIVFIGSIFIAYLLNLLFIFLLKNEYSFFSTYFNSLLKGFFIALILLFVGVFSPFYKIYKSSIEALIKDNSNFSNFKTIDYFLYLGLIFLGFLGVNIISGINYLNSFFYSFGFLFFIVLFYFFISYFLNKLFLFYKKLNLNNFYLFDAIRGTIKPGNVSFLIIFSSIVSFISIFVFYVFSGSFLTYLQKITTNSRDTFIVNISGKDIQKAKKYFNDDEIFEIVSLKIKEINGKKLSEFLNTTDVSREFSREFFSTTNILENKIISGKQLSSLGVSVDNEFADSLGLKLGDEITFGVAGLEKKLKVENFREAKRNGTDPFFYFMLYKDDFLNFPKNYIISYKSTTKVDNLENILSKEVGTNLTFIQVKEIIDIIVKIAGKILGVVYFCLFYIGLFSFICFVVSLSFLKTFKIYKLRLLNLLGGKFKKLVFALNLEYIYLLFIGLLISVIFGSLFLFTIFYFIKYFSIYIISYIFGIIILFALFIVVLIYLFSFKYKK